MGIANQRIGERMVVIYGTEKMSSREIAICSDHIFTENHVLDVVIRRVFMQNAVIGCMCAMQKCRHKGVVHKKLLYASKYGSLDDVSLIKKLSHC